MDKKTIYIVMFEGRPSRTFFSKKEAIESCAKTQIDYPDRKITVLEAEKVKEYGVKVVSDEISL